MAEDYVKVLQALKHDLTVIGRGLTSSQKFERQTGIMPVTRGISNFLQANTFPDNAYVIIATGTQDLMQTMLTVLRAGASFVLVEKPAALSIEELLANGKNLEPFANRVFVAYNRSEERRGGKVCSYRWAPFL